MDINLINQIKDFYKKLNVSVEIITNDIKFIFRLYKNSEWIINGDYKLIELIKTKNNFYIVYISTTFDGVYLLELKNNINLILINNYIRMKKMKKIIK